LRVKILLRFILFTFLILLISAPENANAAAVNFPDAAAGLANARIYEAVVLPGGNIGALLNMSGSVVYGVLNITENRWMTVNLGTTASADVNAASLDLDASGNPHVVFVNTANDLVYRRFTGSSWTAGQTIDSRNIGDSGVLFSPDIAIDTAGRVHIAYMDSRGGLEGGRASYVRNDLMYANNVSGSWVISVRQLGDGSHTSETHNNWREAVAPPKITLTATDSPIGAVFYDRWRTGGVETITFNFRYRIYPSINPILEAPLLISDTDQRAQFSLFDMESDGAHIFSLLRNANDIYLKNGINEESSTRLSFSASAADLFVDTADQNKLYYAAVSGNTLQLNQNGSFKGPIMLPTALSGTHLKVATVIVGSDQYVLYTDSAGRLQTLSFKTIADSSAPVYNAGFPKVTNVNLTGFTVEAQVDESARIFYIAVEDNSQAPTSAEVVAGINYGGVTIRASGNFAVLPNSSNSRAVVGLTASTHYDVYFVAIDGEGNLQASPTLINVTTQASPSTINIAEISGVTAPATGATPITTITETTQFTGTVAWSPMDHIFAPGTVYTATITITPKVGFLLTGVTENFFTVEKAASAVNAANSGVVTAVFPATSIPVAGVTLTSVTTTINVGSTLQLTAAVEPLNATNKNVTWSSANPSVATVTSTGMTTGLVTGVSAGNAVITVSTVDGGKTAANTITVVSPASSNADLVALTVSPGALVPYFNPATTNYEVSVDNSVTSTVVTVTKAHAAAVTTINGTSGGSKTVNLDVGANTITIIATAEDGITQKVYTVNVYRASPAVIPAPDPTPTPSATGPDPDTIPTPIPPAVVEKSIAAGQISEIKLEGVLEIIITKEAIAGKEPKISARVMRKSEVVPLITAANEAELTALSQIVALALIGGEFTAPILLTLNFDPTKIESGQVPSVFVYSERTKRWIYLGGQVEEGTITVTINKFSRYAVFSKKPMPQMIDIDDHWASGSIRTLAGMGVISGYPDGKFNPNAKVTRSEFVSMLTRALNLSAKPEAAVKFKDADDWAKGAIGAAADAGLVRGYPDGTFLGIRDISRAEMAVILQRVISKRLVPVNFNTEVKFVDAAIHPAWAADGIRISGEAGLVRGFPDHSFRAENMTTRAEAAAILYRLIAER
jgi:hypothetical protein